MIPAADFQSGNFSDKFSSEPCGPGLTKLPTLPSSSWKSLLKKNDQLMDCVFWAGEATLTNLVSLCSGGAFITGGSGTIKALCVDVDVDVDVDVGVVALAMITTLLLVPAAGNPLSRL